MRKRAVSIESFTEVNYGDQIKDYNGQRWIFAGVMNREIIVTKYGNTDINQLQTMYPSIFNLLIID